MMIVTALNNIFYLRKNLTLFIPIIIVLGITANLFLSLTRGEEYREDNTLIDLAGRQRMLTQKIVSDLLIGAPSWRDNLQIYKDSAIALKNGGEIISDLESGKKINIVPAPTPELANLLAQQYEAMSRFENKANRYLESVPKKIKSNPDIDELLAISNEALAVSHKAVTEYDSYFNDHLDQGIMLRKTLFVLNLILSVWIFTALLKQYRLSVKLMKANNAALAAAQAKSNFFANISHEIRNPLNVVTTIPDILEQTPLNEMQKKYIETLKHTSKSLLHLMNDLLDFSRFDTGKIMLSNEGFDLKALAIKIMDSFAIKAQEKGLALTLNLDEKISTNIKGDPFRLRQILDNLISNAIKYTDIGRIELSIKRQGYENGKQKIVFQVTDTGIGISANDQKEIFEAFNRVGHYPNKPRGGSGLGLAISKQLAELMGGRISCISRRNVGSKFTLTLMFENAEVVQTEVAPDEAVTSELKPKEQSIRILCVDDSIDNLLVISGLLSTMPQFKITQASDGLDGLEKAKSQKYDLILMDLQMPIMDGRMSAREIRAWERDHKRKKTPIVALTAYKPDDILDANSDFDLYLGKPINREMLISTINQALVVH